MAAPTIDETARALEALAIKTAECVLCSGSFTRPEWAARCELEAGPAHLECVELADREQGR